MIAKAGSRERRFRLLNFLVGALTVTFLLFPLSSSGQSTVTDVGSRNIIKLLADPLRPLVYGLNQGGPAQNSTVVAFDAVSGSIVNEVTIGASPTDFDLSPRTDSLYIIHLISRITRISLQPFTVDATRDLPNISAYSDGLHFDIACGRSGIVYYTDAAWAPSVYVYDFEHSQQLAVYNPDQEGVGDLAVSKSGNTLYTWRQYGWSAGVISTFLRKADCSEAQPVSIDVSSNYGEREPFDTPILLDSSEQRIYYKTRVHDANDLKRVLTTFSEHIYSISQHAELAFGTSKVFNGLTGAQVGTLPFPTTISAVSGDQKRLFVYSTSTRKLVSTPLAQYGEVAGPGLVPTPRDGEAVSAGLNDLSWSSSPVALRYDVYLGNDKDQLASSTSTNSPYYIGSTAATSIRLDTPVQQQGVYYWRVDIISINGSALGRIWSFQVAPIVVVPRKINLVAVAGSKPLPVPIMVQTNGSGGSWSISESIPWASVNPASGSGNAVVSVSVDPTGLSPGSYTNSLLFTSGDYSFSVPLELQVIPLEITKMVADLERPYIYAIQGRSGGTTQCYLLFINTDTGEIERALAIGSNLVDLDINYAEGRLYLADWGQDTTHVVDLRSQQPLDALHLGTDVFKINSRRPGRIMTEGLDQWVNLNLFDSLTGTFVKSAFVREGDGEMDPKGEFYYHCDNNISNAHIEKYRISNDAFEDVKASLEHPYGSRNLLFSPDGSRLFWRGYVYDADLNELGNLQEEILACTFRGELAFSASKVYNSANGQVLTNLPFSSSSIAVSGDQQRLYAFTSGKKLETLHLSDIAPVQGGDLIPHPAAGEVVSLPIPELAWSTSPFALQYKVFFGTNEVAVSGANESSPEFLGATDKTSLTLGSLAAGLSYFWRVDAVGFSGTRLGHVWSFNTSPLVVTPKALTVQTVAGAPPPTRDLQIASPGMQWTVSESASWFSVSPASGTGSGSLRLKIEANLPAGIYTNILKITAGSSTLEIPVSLQVVKMSLSKLLADRERPYIYGLHPGSGTFDDAFLVFINTETEQIENVLPIGANPTDFSINYFEDRLYVSNWLRNRTRVVDLIKQVELPSLQLGNDVFKINAGRSGRIYIEQQDQWIDMNIVDSLTGTQVARGFVREGDGEGDPSGTFYFHCDNNSSGATIQKYLTLNDGFELVATSSNHGYGSRNLVLSGDGSRVFWQGYIYDSSLRELGSLGEEIYAVSETGQFAFSSSKVYDTVSRQANFSLPFSTTVMTVAGTQDKVFLYSPEGSIRALEMREITNRPPVALNLVVATEEDTPVSVAASATDPESDALTFVVVTPPAFGHLSSTPMGWVYTPSSNFAGSVSFTYLAKDRWRSSLQALVTINVAPVNDPPLAADLSLTAVKGLPRTVQLSGSDPDGDLLTYKILALPQHGALNGVAPTLQFVPAEGYTGPDEFRYAVSDGKAAPIEATVKLIVQEPVCRVVPPGLISWWSGDGWVEDALGGARLAPDNWTNYSSGMVGRAFAFSTNAPGLTAPVDSNLLSYPGFTLETWLKLEGSTNSEAIFQWSESGPKLYSANGILHVAIVASNNQIIDVQAGTRLIPGVFQHIALTFDRRTGKFRLFLDGHSIAEYLDLNLSHQGAGMLSFGAPLNSTGELIGMIGSLDEISMYSRPLSDAEIEEIYLASSQGKCAIQLPPSFSAPAELRSIPAGGSIQLAPAVRASPPLDYQWFRDGEALFGETNATLTVSNIANFSPAIFSLRASNALGVAFTPGCYVFTQFFPSLVNGGFESGNTSGWVVSDIPVPYSGVRVRPRSYRPSSLFFPSEPTEGRFALVHGFDGAGPGTIRVAQDIAVPSGNPQLTFDYRAAWNLRNALYDRTIDLVIEPTGGGLPFDFRTILRATAGSYVADTGPKSGSIDLSAYSGRSIRVSFDADIPEPNHGPGFFQLDNVNLTSGGPPVILSQTRNIAVVSNTPVAVLQVSAEGGLPLQYTWFRNGMPVPGGTNSFLDLSGSSGNAGVYRAEISNPQGSVSTEPVTVEIVSPMQIGTPYWRNGAVWLPLGFSSGTAVVESSDDLQNWTNIGAPLLINEAWSIFDGRPNRYRFYRLRIP